MTRRAAPILALLLCLLAAPAAHAGIWQAIPSNTSETITAVDYQSDARFWFSTASGKLFYRQAGGAFVEGTGLSGSIVFTDIAFEPGTGLNGIAVGNDNNVWRSTNGGQSWTKITTPTNIRNNPSCTNFGFDDTPMTMAFDDAFSVAWATADDVYITGNNGNILKSANKGANFTEINHKPDASDGTACRLQAEHITDSSWISAGDAFFVERYFGGVHRTNNGLTTNADVKAEAVNNYIGVPRIAAAANNVWVVDRCDCLSHSQDDGVTFPFGGAKVSTPNGPRIQALHDVAVNGGTVITVGTANQVLNSINGTDFFYNNPDTSSDWKTVDMFDSSHAAIGGAGGALAITTAGNTVPDITPPTLTITGPETGKTGTPITFTSAANDTGGSGLNPNGFNWTLAGFPAQTSANATFTFVNPGTYTVRATAKDNAGNVSDQASHTITVAQGSAPAPTFDVPASGVTAKISGKYVRVTIRGKIKVPAGFDPATACRGTVVMTIKKVKGKGQLVGQRNAKLKSNCSFRKTIRVPRSRLKGAKRIKVTARFVKNAVLSGKSKTFIVRVRR